MAYIESDTLDGVSDFSHFGRDFFWGTGAFMNTVDIYGVADAPYTSNLTLSGDWELRSLIFAADTVGGLTANLTDFGAGQRVIRSIVSYDDSDLRLNLDWTSVDSIILFGGSVDATFGDGRLSFLYAADSNDRVMLGAGGGGALSLGSGNDTFIGGSGEVHSVVMGAGDDVALLESGHVLGLHMENGDDTVEGGVGGIDLVNLGQGTNTFIGGGGSVLFLIGGNDVDTITMNASGSNDIQANGGNDSISLGSGYVGTVDGGDGNDTVIGGSGGAGTIRTGGGQDRVVLGAGGAELISTGNDRDVLDLSLGRADHVNSGDGNDLVILGAKKAGTVWLGAGNDELRVVDTTEGQGLVVRGDSGSDLLSLASFAADILLDLSAEGTWQQFAGGLNYVSLTGFENIRSGTGADSLTGSSSSNQIFGENGNDALYGGVGADSLYGGEDNDILCGGAGADRLYGGAGARDRAMYSDSTAGLRADLQVSSANTGIAAGDVYVGIEDLYGSNLGDSLLGNAGANMIWGANGNDALYGRDGADSLDGGEGNDILYGGTGNDTLTGGTGNDSFVLSSVLGAGNVDRISDFDVVDDRIRLDDAVFAGLSAGGLAASAFAANLTGRAADAFDRIIYETDTGRLYFDADGTGAGARIHFATLTTDLALTNTDFLVF